jgi:chorismate mutase
VGLSDFPDLIGSKLATSAVARKWFALRATRGAIVAVLPLLLGCGPGAGATAVSAIQGQQQADQLVELIGRRLELMQPVARWKWQNDQPLEDPDREAALIESLTAKARERGLNTAVVRAFFEAQFDAAKQVQRFWWERCKSGELASDGPVPDLRTDLRPRLSALSEELLDVLADSASFAHDPGWQQAVRHGAQTKLTAEYVTDALRQQVLDPLGDLGRLP